MDDNYQYHLLYLPRGIERLEKLGTCGTYPKNMELNTPGTVPDCCYLVKSGRVLCYEFSYNGDQRVYNIMEPGSMFMEECLLTDMECPVIFKTLDECELVRIDKCDLKRAFKHDIDVVMDVCESLSTKFLSSMEHLRLGPRQSEVEDLQDAADLRRPLRRDPGGRKHPSESQDQPADAGGHSGNEPRDGRPQDEGTERTGSDRHNQRIPPLPQ